MKKINIGKRIGELFDLEQWALARHLIKSELKKAPADHWLLTRLGMTYYEELDYTKSREEFEAALAIAPNCPLVLWDYACALDMLGADQEALGIFQRLIKRGVESIANDECGEGSRWAQSLINDCHYRAAKCYQMLGNSIKALRYYDRHLSLRKPGIPSLYSLKEVRKAIRAYRLGLES